MTDKIVLNNKVKCWQFSSSLLGYLCLLLLDECPSFLQILANNTVYIHTVYIYIYTHTLVYIHLV